MPTAQRTLRAPNAVFFAPVKAQLEAGGQATFRLTGRSMRPFLEHERDHVVVASARGRQIKRGDVVLAQLGADVYVLHRVWRIEGDNMVLRGDGNPYTTEQCRRGEYARALGEVGQMTFADCEYEVAYPQCGCGEDEIECYLRVVRADFERRE